MEISEAGSGDNNMMASAVVILAGRSVWLKLVARFGGKTVTKFWREGAAAIRNPQHASLSMHLCSQIILPLLPAPSLSLPFFLSIIITAPSTTSSPICCSAHQCQATAVQVTSILIIITVRRMIQTLMMTTPPHARPVLILLTTASQ